MNINALHELEYVNEIKLSSIKIVSRTMFDVACYSTQTILHNSLNRLMLRYRYIIEKN